MFINYEYYPTLVSGGSIQTYTLKRQVFAWLVASCHEPIKQRKALCKRRLPAGLSDCSLPSHGLMKEASISTVAPLGRTAFIVTFDETSCRVVCLIQEDSGGSPAQSIPCAIRSTSSKAQ